MNCKPGDLAVIVLSRNRECEPNIGRIVEVIEQFHGQMVGGHDFGPVDGVEWVIRSSGTSLVSADASGMIYVDLHVCADFALRPIRDNPGNESFVTEARKSLPAPLERAKPDEVEA